MVKSIDLDPETEFDFLFHHFLYVLSNSFPWALVFLDEDFNNVKSQNFSEMHMREYMKVVCIVPAYKLSINEICKKNKMPPWLS